MISKLLTLAQLPGYLRFAWALRNPEHAQKKKLSEILSSIAETQNAKKLGLTAEMSYQEFAQVVPVTDYSDWEKLVIQQKNGQTNLICDETERYQPTSGSTSAQKWIPYSKAFMREMDGAVQPWLGDVGFRNGRAFAGSQYWSLSWLPQAQRENRPSNDDLELLPGWKRYILQKMMAVPSAVTFTESMEQSQFATLAYLCARQDLSLVSVWSPTFWLTLLEKLTAWQPMLAQTLLTGEWALPHFNTNMKAPKNLRASAMLSMFQGEVLYKKLWPKLAMISCWDSAGSELWAKKIRKLHPQVSLQGKGLWATEGVITIPFRNKFPAALTSHFLEWLDLTTNTIHPTWDLKIGQMVQPLLTGGHGLLRYKLSDALEVTGFLGKTATFEFRGRLKETDLVGEKISPQLALETFKMVEEATGAKLMSLFAVRTNISRPYYLVLAPESKISSEKIALAVEESLSRVFHYKLARELGQLGPVQVRLEKEPERTYQMIFEKKGMLSGDIKVEPLSEILEDFLL